MISTTEVGCGACHRGNGFGKLTLVVGTCTDRTWNSQQCPGWCFAESKWMIRPRLFSLRMLTKPVSDSNTSIPLAKCQTADGEDWYCCPGDDNCSCQSGKDAVKLGASQPTTVTVIGSTSWPGIQSQTSTFSTSAFANTNQNTGASTAASTSVLSSSTTASTMASTMTTSTTSTGRSAAGQASGTSSPVGVAATQSTSTNTGLAAGLGAGLGVAAIAIAALAFFLFRKRKGDRAATHPQNAVLLYKSEMDGSPPVGHVEQKQHPGFYGGGYNTYQSSGMAADTGNTRLEMPAGQSGIPAQYNVPTYANVRHELGS